MNTKKCIVSSILLVFLGFTGPTSAQIFQNNNTACESKEVLCTSGKCDDFFNSGVFSLSGKSIAGPADINGDGFPDLVAMILQAGSTAGSVNEIQQISILSSQGKVQCGVGNGQLTELDYSLGANLDSRYSSVLVGPLDGDNRSDIFVSSTLFSASVVSSAITALNPTGADGAVINSAKDRLPTGFQPASADISEHTEALFDCNNDGALDAIVAGLHDFDNDSSLDFYGFEILVNNKGRLIPNATVNSTGILYTDDNLNAASITVGDFNRDGLIDFTYVVQDNVEMSRLLTFLNKGNCTFDAPATNIDLTAAALDQHQGVNPLPVSSVAADFNGDGNLDIAISERGLAANLLGVHYFFGDGTGKISSNKHVTQVFPANPRTPIPHVLAAGCLNHDNVSDLVVSYGNYYEDGPGFAPGAVAVITSKIDNTGFSLNQPIALNLGEPTHSAHGIEVVDLDQQGGDDVVVLASKEADGTRKAYVFMNQNEVLSANAGSDKTIQIGTSVDLRGQCQFNPDDPGAQYEVQWSIVGPNARSATLSSTNSFTTIFAATAVGTYQLQLQCRSECTTIARDTVTVEVTALPVPPTPPNPPVPPIPPTPPTPPTPEPPPVPTPPGNNPPAPPTIFTSSQGGCVASLNPSPFSKSARGFEGLAVFLMGLWALRRRIAAKK